MYFIYLAADKTIRPAIVNPDYCLAIQGTAVVAVPCGAETTAFELDSPVTRGVPRCQGYVTSESRATCADVPRGVASATEYVDGQRRRR
jgi:hypothetical protein